MRLLQLILNLCSFSPPRLRLPKRDPISAWQERADRIGRECDRLKRRMQRAMAAEAGNLRRA